MVKSLLGGIKSCVCILSDIILVVDCPSDMLVVDSLGPSSPLITLILYTLKLCAILRAP